MNDSPIIDPWETKPDERVKTKSDGYLKIEDGQTLRIRVDANNIYRYYTVKPEGYKMPMKNNELKELLNGATIDEIIEDDSIEVRERYAFIVWNYELKTAQVWQVSRKVFDNLRSLHRDDEWEGGLNSNDIKVTRSGSDTSTTYTISYARESKPLTPEQQSSLIEVDVKKMVAGAIKL